MLEIFKINLLGELGFFLIGFQASKKGKKTCNTLVKHGQSYQKRKFNYALKYTYSVHK